MTGSGWRVVLSDGAKTALRMILDEHPHAAPNVVRSLFDLEDNPFGMSQQTEPPDPIGLFRFDFFVGTLQFRVLFEFAADEQTLAVVEVRAIGFA